VNEVRKYKITKIGDLDATTKAFCFEPVEGELPDYKAGQFIFLHLLDDEGNTIVKRPYSIASSPDMPHLELCIKLIGGELTGKLESMEIGSVVGMSNPGGPLTYNNEPNAVFIAGGTGISLVLSMLRHIAHEKLYGEFLLFYSVRKKENILYQDELIDLQKQNPNIKVVITLTREEGEWGGEKGRLCHEMIGRYIPNAKEFTWWVCGPMGLIKGMKQCLSSLEVDPKKIHMEGWG
jgi:ferredoxin-NADP reductase